MKLSVTEEVGKVLKMMRSLRKAGGAQIEIFFLKRFGALNSLKPGRQARIVSAMWDGTGVFGR